MMGKESLTIKELAALSGTDEETIRLYRDESLLTPLIGEEGERYSPDDVERLAMIKRLVEELGVNLAGVEVILNMRQQMLHMQADFERIIDDMKLGILKGLSDYEARMKRPMIESRSAKKIKVKVED